MYIYMYTSGQFVHNMHKMYIYMYTSGQFVHNIYAHGTLAGMVSCYI